MATKLTDMELEEVSLVDEGANPGAKILLAKAKVSDGHNERQVESLPKGAAMAEEQVSLEKLQEQFTQFQGRLADVTKRAERAEAVNKLSPEERSIFDGLAVADQDKFLAGDGDLQKRVSDEIAKRKTTPNPEVEELRKNQQRLEAQLNEERTIAKTERDRRVLAEYTELAKSKFGNLPLEDGKKASVLKAAREKLTNEEFDDLEKLLLAGNEAMGQRMKGAPGTPATAADANTAIGKIEAKAKARAAEKGIPYPVAKSQIYLEEPTLYEEARAEMGRTN